MVYLGNLLVYLCKYNCHIMKRFNLLLAFLLFIGVCYAQKPTREVRRIEIEPSIGWNNIIVLGAEARYNFCRPWDIGVKVSMDWDGNQCCVVSDYNIEIGQTATIFCGAGVGAAHVTNLDEREVDDGCLLESQSCLYFMPRVGLELFRHVRLTVSCNAYNFKAYVPTITLGVAIGGGKKKPNE